jgi:hypothetical protein
VLLLLLLLDEDEDTEGTTVEVTVVMVVVSVKKVEVLIVTTVVTRTVETSTVEVVSTTEGIVVLTVVVVIEVNADATSVMVEVNETARIHEQADKYSSKLGQSVAVGNSGVLEELDVVDDDDSPVELASEEVGSVEVELELEDGDSEELASDEVDETEESVDDGLGLQTPRFFTLLFFSEGPGEAVDTTVDVETIVELYAVVVSRTSEYVVDSNSMVVYDVLTDTMTST